jgi:hypothetical protein
VLAFFGACTSAKKAGFFFKCFEKYSFCYATPKIDYASLHRYYTTLPMQWGNARLMVAPRRQVGPARGKKRLYCNAAINNKII